ncbi:MAG: hypothetical protein P8177_12595 [Gemmatimonadota bacterium]
MTFPATEPEVERRRLPAVRLAVDPHPDGVELALERRGLVEGVVGAAVVHHDDLVAGVVEAEQGAEGRLDHRPLVVGGQDDADGRQVRAAPVALVPGVDGLLDGVEVGEPDQAAVAEQEHAEEDEHEHGDALGRQRAQLRGRLEADDDADHHHAAEGEERDQAHGEQDRVVGPSHGAPPEREIRRVIEVAS